MPINRDEIEKEVRVLCAKFHMASIQTSSFGFDQDRERLFGEYEKDLTNFLDKYSTKNEL